MMKKALSVVLAVVFSGICAIAYSEGVLLKDAPEFPKDTELKKDERVFSYRGKIGSYVFPPSRVGAHRTGR